MKPGAKQITKQNKKLYKVILGMNYGKKKHLKLVK